MNGLIVLFLVGLIVVFFLFKCFVLKVFGMFVVVVGGIFLVWLVDIDVFGVDFIFVVLSGLFVLVILDFV